VRHEEQSIGRLRYHTTVGTNGGRGDERKRNSPNRLRGVGPRWGRPNGHGNNGEAKEAEHVEES